MKTIFLGLMFLCGISMTSEIAGSEYVKRREVALLKVKGNTVGEVVEGRGWSGKRYSVAVTVENATAIAQIGIRADVQISRADFVSSHPETSKFQNWFPISPDSLVLVAYDEFTANKMTFLASGEDVREAWKDVLEFKKVVFSDAGQLSDRLANSIRDRISPRGKIFFRLLFDFDKNVFVSRGPVEALAEFMSDSSVTFTAKQFVLGSLEVPDSLDDSCKKLLATSILNMIARHSHLEQGWETRNLLIDYNRLFLSELQHNSFHKSALQVISPETAKELISAIEHNENFIKDKGISGPLLQWLRAN